MAVGQSWAMTPIDNRPDDRAVAACLTLLDSRPGFQSCRRSGKL